MMKRNKKLNLNKVELANLNEKQALKGGANEFTRPIRMCMLSYKDIDCTPQDPIKLTVNNDCRLGN
ncbi:hypothetical protein [Kordia sp.]|uniref:hypothetical protein n=1 Tax=Kordia sp. TaxID=1965332 RepID=UPI003B5BF5D3